MSSIVIAEQRRADSPPQYSASRAPRSPARSRRPTWERIILLIVLGYEALGCLSGGSLLVLAPDGHLMDMQVEGMDGFFPDFFVPGLLLIGLGILMSSPLPPFGVSIGRTGFSLAWHWVA
jgi:hypothetical protein